MENHSSLETVFMIDYAIRNGQPSEHIHIINTKCFVEAVHKHIHVHVYICIHILVIKEE